MGSFILRRLVYTLPILLGTTLLLFLIFNVAGGDPAYQLAGKHPTAESLASIRAEYGFDKPLWQQYLATLKSVFTFDFGRSYSTKQQISEMIFDGVGASLSITLPPFIFAEVLCVFIGMLLAVWRGSLFDKGVVAICAAAQSVSVLVYVLAGQYFLAYRGGLFPISGYDHSWTGRWGYLVLPWIIYILLSLAPLVRLYRTIILDELYQDYVRTARSKGLAERTVLFVHVLRNSMIPIITNVVVFIPTLILGSLLLEAFFQIPGLGDLVVRAIANSDRPVIFAIAVLGTVGYVFFNLVSDLLCAWTDPRVRLE